MDNQLSFIILSYAIQFVEGIGISILVASTVVVTGGIDNKQIWKFSVSPKLFFSIYHMLYLRNLET